MPRQPKARKKKIRGSTYYHTEAGGSPTYFGNVQEVSYEDARRLLSAHIKSLVEEEPGSKSKTLTAGELIRLLIERAVVPPPHRVRLRPELPACPWLATVCSTPASDTS